MNIFPTMEKKPQFWSKNGHFSNFVFSQCRPGKCVLRYSRTKKTTLQAKKTTSSKSRKIEIFPKGLTHGFSAKIAIFLTFFFGNIGQETVFCNILERKTVFLDFKNKKFNQSKISDFSTGVNAWFWSKNGHFSNFFFFGHIRQENVFYDILERKNAFLGYKNKNFKKQKN